MNYNWVHVTIEELRSFDVVLNAYQVYTINRNREGTDGWRVITATRLDDGAMTTWRFSPQSHGYLMERFAGRELEMTK